MENRKRETGQREDKMGFRFPVCHSSLERGRRKKSTVPLLGGLRAWQTAHTSRRMRSMAARRDRATVLVLTAALLALMAREGALAATTSYSVVSDVRIPMSDGILLDSDEYIPT